MDSLKEGDVLVVPDLSRLGRSMLDVFDLLSLLLRKKVELRVVKGGYVFKDDTQSKVFAFAFTLASEIERDMLSQRTKEALARKKSEGVKLGRPEGSKGSKLDKYYGHIKELRAKNVSIQA